MAVNWTYDETAGHPVIASAMVARRPFFRSALFGAYMELLSVSGKNARAAALAGKPDKYIDRVITYADVIALEPEFTDCLVAGLCHFDYMRHIGDGRFQLALHEHLAWQRTAMQLWWEAQRKRENSNDTLKAEVRWRDGDQCRCCRVILRWDHGGATKDNGGTLDHVNPGQEIGSAKDLAAVCRRCNGIRSDRPDANQIAPLQPTPKRPYYRKSTAEYLRAEGYLKDPLGKPMRWTGQEHVLPRIQILPRPATQADTATSDLTPSEIPLPAQWAWEAHNGHDSHTCGQRPGIQPDTAPQRLTQAPESPREPASDPASSRTPQTAPKPPENAAKTTAERSGFSPPEHPPPRTKQALPGGGLRGVGWDGLVVEGVGLGSGPGSGSRRSRARRGKGSR